MFSKRERGKFYINWRGNEASKDSWLRADQSVVEIEYEMLFFRGISTDFEG